MPYRLTLGQKRGCLHARVRGTNSAETVRAYTQEIHDACVNAGCRAVLIEENLAGPSIHLAAVLAIVAERSAQAVQRQQRIAFVDTNPEHDLSRMEFAEDAAVNRGANMRLFGSIEAAERWLLAGPASALGAALDPSDS
jgi:predicted methyltransferase MtxX (methanogen marker protein 4)